MTEEKEDNAKAVMVGFASNKKDEHKRITSGEDFYLYGGSEEVHSNMTEGMLEFNALRIKYGKNLEDLTENEYYDIVSSIKGKKINWHYFLNHFNK